MLLEIIYEPKNKIQEVESSTQIKPTIRLGDWINL